ncbi:MAG TPA: carbohydrate kinase, partial [Spirochaetia bacterium]|nr:carbohydrate kinase [Spirochaetia bacterium]
GGKGPGAGMEILITRQDEVLAYDGRDFFRAPFDPVRLDGRAGRGDTCFLSYIARRARSGVAEATRYAAALTSMKMEKPGPFSGTVAQVEERMRRQGR